MQEDNIFINTFFTFFILKQNTPKNYFCWWDEENRKTCYKKCMTLITEEYIEHEFDRNDVKKIIEALNSKPSDKTSEEFLNDINKNKMKINNKLKQIFSIFSEDLLNSKFPIIMSFRKLYNNFDAQKQEKKLEQIKTKFNYEINNIIKKLLQINSGIEVLLFLVTNNLEKLDNIEHSTLKTILDDYKYTIPVIPANIKKFFICLCDVYILYQCGFFVNKSRISEK